MEQLLDKSVRESVEMICSHYSVDDGTRTAQFVGISPDAGMKIVLEKFHQRVFQIYLICLTRWRSGERNLVVWLLFQLQENVMGWMSSMWILLANTPVASLAFLKH